MLELKVYAGYLEKGTEAGRGAAVVHLGNLMSPRGARRTSTVRVLRGDKGNSLSKEADIAKETSKINSFLEPT